VANEGTTIPMVALTTNVTTGTVLYWTIDYDSSSSSADFSTNSGSVIIGGSFASGSAQIDVPIIADATTEGAETFKVQLRTGSTGGTIVATSLVVTIADSSGTPNPPALTDPSIESNYDAGLGATFAQAWTEIRFMTTGTLRTIIGDNSAPETRSIVSGQWLTTSPTAVSTTTAGLYDIELTPSSATLAIDGTTVTLGGDRTTQSTGTSWNTRLQLGTQEVYRYLFVEANSPLGGTFNQNATAYFTATIYLHGTNTVQTSTAITMVSSAGSIGV
jgi:hypothetical protein